MVRLPPREVSRYWTIRYGHSVNASWRPGGNTSRHNDARSVANSRCPTAPRCCWPHGWRPPDDGPERQEIARRLESILSQLSKLDREILLLRGVEGLSNEQAATRLEISPAAARKRFTRALLRARTTLKTLPLAAMLDPRQLQRFQNEARAAAMLEHPHIAGVFSVGSDHGGPQPTSHSSATSW